MEEDIEFIKNKLVCEANYHNKDSCINCDYDNCQVKKFERIVNELEKKDKIIDLITYYIANKVRNDYLKCFLRYEKDCDNKQGINCQECIKQYFKNKVGE